MFIKEVDPVEGAVPGAVIAIQSFGDFLGYNPHAHILLTDGCFHDNDMFKVASHFDPKALEEIFRYKVFRLLISKGKITEDMVKLLKSWRHSGFHVFCGNRIQPGDKGAMESLAVMCSHRVIKFFKIRFLADFWMNIPGCFLQGRFIFTPIRNIRLRCASHNKTFPGFQGRGLLWFGPIKRKNHIKSHQKWK